MRSATQCVASVTPTEINGATVRVAKRVVTRFLKYREFFRQWVVTNAQQDNSLRGLKRVVQAAETFVEEDLGVIRFPVEDRHASPFFLEKDDKGWMLDFYAMNQLIRFNHKNQWHFIKTDHKFSFAFT